LLPFVINQRRLSFAFFAACVNRAAAQVALLRLIPMANTKVRLRVLS